MTQLGSVHVSFVAFILVFIGAVSCELVAVSFFPHGGIAYSPWPHPFLGDQSPLARENSRKIHIGATNHGNALQALNISTWIVLTPHDLAASKAYLLYGGSTAQGNGDESEAGHSYSIPAISLHIDTALTTHVQATCNASSTFDLELLSSPHSNSGVQLQWGSVVPAHFVKPSQAVILSFPTQRYVDNAVPMTKQLTDVGRCLATSIRSTNQRLGLLISGDLAHTHLCNGPYGCTPQAVEFDNAVAAFIRYGYLAIDAKPLERLAPQALSCGYAGLMVASGILEELRLVDKQVGKQVEWKPLVETVGPVAPSYYGMMVASYIRHSID